MPRATSTPPSSRRTSLRTSRLISNASSSRYVGIIYLDGQEDADQLCQVGSKRHELKMKYVLRALIKSIEQSPLARTSTPQVNWDPYPLSNPDKGTELTQDYLWAVSVPHFEPLYSPPGSSLHPVCRRWTLFRKLQQGN